MHKNKRNVFLITMMVLGTACSQNHSSSESFTSAVAGIVGGQEASSADFSKPMFSSVVAVSWSEESSGRDVQCTGTLIAPDLVLTASHCLVGAPSASDVQIDFLTLSVDDSLGLPKMLAKKMVLNSSYVQNPNNRFDDLALILLPQNAPAGTQIATLATTAGQALPFFAEATAVGYGKSDDSPDMVLSEKNGSGILRSVKLGNVVTMDHDGSPISGMLATDQSQSGICQGDSGGPLFASSLSGSLTVVGVTQFVTPSQDGKHLCGGYGFFVNVAEHSDWIAAQSAALRK